MSQTLQDREGILAQTGSAKAPQNHQTSCELIGDGWMSGEVADKRMDQIQWNELLTCSHIMDYARQR